MATVGCAGILVEDTVCGPVKEFPPEGSLTALDALPVHVGGCAANVSVGLTKLGIDVDIVGCLGNDPAAMSLEAALVAHRVGCQGLRHTDAYPTSKTVILLLEGQDRRFFHVFGANRAFSVAMIDRDWVASLDIFYLGGLFIMPDFDTDAFRDLLTFCREKGVVTVVDVVTPADFDRGDELFRLLPWIDWFLPNDDEGKLITGHDDPADQLKALATPGASRMVTLGPDGILASDGEKTWRAGVYPVDVVDPSGCGDAFAAGLIAGICRGLELPDILRVAGAVGASAARKLGTTDGVFTAGELDAFLAGHELDITEVAP